LYSGSTTNWGIYILVLYNDYIPKIMTTKLYNTISIIIILGKFTIYFMMWVLM